MHTKTMKDVLDFFTYKPDTNEKFVLEEKGNDQQEQASDQGFVLPKLLHNVEALLVLNNELIKLHGRAIDYLSEMDLPQIVKLKDEMEEAKSQLDKLKSEFVAHDYWQENIDAQLLSTSLEDNHNILKLAYKTPENFGVSMRNLSIGVQGTKGLLVFLEAMIDKKQLDLAIMQPLMGLSHVDIQQENLIDELLERYLPCAQTTKVSDYNLLQDAINRGKAVLLLDGVNEAIAIEAIGVEHRSISEPKHEQSLRGAQNAFTEVLGVNIGQVRSLLKTSDLVIRTMKVGTKGQQLCAVLYLESVANPAVVIAITDRIKQINIDFVGTVSMLEELIVDTPLSIFPQSISTERPDRVAYNLAVGRVVVMLDGTPFVLIVPVTFFSLLEAIDDYAGNFIYINFYRLIRYFGLFLSVLFPALYLAVTVFHPEAVPTELLLAIAASRLEVPFPSIAEILIMELSFELIREGGLRIPGILGSTIGIVGALILGQAAVSAKIVSPVIVIIVAVTGLASFAIPEHRLINAMAMLRFIFIILGGFLGLVSVACGMVLLLTLLCSLKSFGVPYMAPVAPKTKSALQGIVRTPFYRTVHRSDELNVKDVIKQSGPR